MGQAIVSTVSPYTVSGDVWFKSYINSLSCRDQLSIQFKMSNKKFSILQIQQTNIYLTEQQIILAS